MSSLQLCRTNRRNTFNHYVGYHRINPENYFFNCLFKREEGLLCKECCRCGDFLVSKSDKIEHNFLKHYSVGERKPPQEKPISVIKKGEITIYQISFKEHSAEYDFYDHESIINDFLFNIKYIFEPSRQVSIKGDISIENIENAPGDVPDTADIKSLRYWSTNVYRAVYFNDYVIASIRNDILKRVLNNNLSGSAWRFNRFYHLNVKVIDKSDTFKLSK